VRSGRKRTECARFSHHRVTTGDGSPRGHYNPPRSASVGGVVDLRKDASHRYSPAAVVAVSREAVIGVPAEISTSYAERSNLSLRMASRRFTRCHARPD
jgi:hypothetical protein